MLTVTPSSGVQELTQFTAHAASTDSDGDTVTVSWDILGKPMTGPDQVFTAGSGGNFTISATATELPNGFVS